MTLREAFAAVRHGLLKVAVFSGRETQPRFWPYAAIVALLATALGGIPLYVRWERLTFGFEGMTAPADAADWANFVPLLYWTIGVSMLAIGLLASAVARRLHDRDQSGSWGLIPLPFFGFGAYAMVSAFEALSRPGEPENTLFVEGFLSLVLYMASLGFLIAHLAGPGTPGPNRYGPDPRALPSPQQM